MALKMTPEKFVEKYGHRMAGWNNLVQPQPARRKPVQRRPLWDEVKIVRSSGTDGKTLTASALYPKGPDQTYAQAQAAAVSRGAKSPLGTGVAKVSSAKNDAWKARAEKIRKAES